jgi:hypothetical protein
MENRAAHYRLIATDVRATADNSSDERVRQGMLMAADVWERLATLAERTVPQSLQADTRHPNT